MRNTTKIEVQRQIIQRELDLQKTPVQRNILGQFATPIDLAQDILRDVVKIMPKGEKIRFLDPAIGTGVFFSALNSVFSPISIAAATGVEVDEHYGKPAIALWKGSILDYRLTDFTRLSAPVCDSQKFNLIVCNPPYVRHHHINGQKERLHQQAFTAANMKLSGLAGLYCYFMALCHGWMQKNGVAVWLIPSEFMDVNYGQAIREYLLREVSLLRIHRFDPTDVQFDDALVSSAVVWLRMRKPILGQRVRFSYGGSIERPTHEKMVDAQVLIMEKKWTRFPLSEERQVLSVPRLGDFFAVKRGIATGDNKYFILTRADIEIKGLPLSQFRPILPSPRYLVEMEVRADERGFPDLEKQLFVLDCLLPIDEVERLYPRLYEYLQKGIRSGVSQRYLCRSRKVWYTQENRSASYFYCTYMGRGGGDGKKPFRFILNRSRAIVANSYLILYPKPVLEALLVKHPELVGLFWEALNSMTKVAMVDEGRVYGGGMHKLEPSELANVPALEILKLIKT
jgi:adenine-specific DNA-methyltransferase